MAKVKNPRTSGEPAPYRKSTAREYFESICVAVILALFVRTFVVQAFKIPTGSMENNLLIGDHLLVNKFVFAPTVTGLEEAVLPIDPIRRGDIIVFKYPEEPERDFIKRVIGLPGETIELRKKRVYIDETLLDEPYVRFLIPPGEDDGGDFDVRVQYGPVTVPEGHYFMMGDNRDNSQDSRYWGFLPEEYVKGRALFVYFSLGEQSGLSSLVTGVRWGRFFHQIHWFEAAIEPSCGDLWVRVSIRGHAPLVSCNLSLASTKHVDTPSMRTRFRRLRLPATIVTARRGTSSSAARRSTTSAFAAPSTGGAWRRSSSAPLRTPARPARLARGVTRTSITTPSGVGVIMPLDTVTD